MKYKKYNYILVLIIMLLIGINGVYAAEKYSKTCYYKNDANDINGVLTLKSGYDTVLFKGPKDFASFYVDKAGATIMHKSEQINNWFGGLRSLFKSKETTTGVVFDTFYTNANQANQDSNPACPKYVILQVCTAYRVWGTNSQTLAEKAVDEINSESDCKGYYASYGREENGEIIAYTAEEYYSGFGDLELGGTNAPLTCEGLFGDKDDDGEENDVGDDGVASISYIINEILGYVRVIVPILIIVLGTVDLASAVVSGKEDGMKKAQMTFVKRLIAGVCVFLSPILINIIMDLAEIVWEGLGYSACSF